MSRDTAQGDPADDLLQRVAHELREAAQTHLLLRAQAGPIDLPHLQHLRGLSATAVPTPCPDVQIEEHHVAVPDANGEVLVYLVNRQPGRRQPAILHTHGGGFILESAMAELRALQTLARELECTIATVEYSLAPEARFTRSTAETYAALVWLHRQAPALGIDQSRIAVMGESAGGGHAALLAIAARDRGEVPLILQVLLYPMLDDRTGSSRPTPPNVAPVGWDAAANRFGWGSFLGVPPGTANVPSAAVPARAQCLTGLPPTFIAVGGVDLFLHENIEYAVRLTDAGVPTELHVTPGAFHAFDRIAPEAAPSRRLREAQLDALRRAFRQS